MACSGAFKTFLRKLRSFYAGQSLYDHFYVTLTFSPLLHSNCNFQFIESIIVLPLMLDVCCVLDEKYFATFQWLLSLKVVFN